jgi:hypothetical protein
MRTTLLAAMIATGALLGVHTAALAQDQDAQTVNTDKADAKKNPPMANPPAAERTKPSPSNEEPH